MVTWIEEVAEAFPAQPAMVMSLKTVVLSGMVTSVPLVTAPQPPTVLTVQVKLADPLPPPVAVMVTL